MLRKLMVPALAMVALPTIASAQFEAGDFELTLSGRGTMTRDADGSSYAANVSLGYFLTPELEVGIKQGVEWLDAGNPTPGVDVTDWGGQTAIFASFHFDLGAFQPFVGGEAGYTYFAGTDDESKYVAPVAGLKYFVNGTTFLFGDVRYVYNLEDPGSNASFWESFLGIGFRF